MSAFVMVCQETSAGYYVAETDSVDIITPLADLPCSANVIDKDTLNRKLQGLVRSVANQGGWTFGDFNMYERDSYSDLDLTCKRT